MNDCNGLFGKWFGHRFESHLIESKCDHSISNLNGLPSNEVMDLILSLSHRKYKLACNRCGQIKDEDELEKTE